MNTPSASDRATTRREIIQQRQKTSALWAIIHLLGSLRLAMVLLFTIAAAIALATVTESRFDTAVARHYFYRAPWFAVWLMVLCLNLACAALSRWPWERKHLGFVITHCGIILLLIGAMVGRVKGFEAFLTLHRDVPQRRLIVPETILTVQSAPDGGLDRMSFPVEVSPPAEKKPRVLDLPGSSLRLKVDGYTPQMIESKDVTASEDAAAAPGIALEFHSQMMGQTVPVSLLLDPVEESTFDFFGLARVLWVKKLPDPPSRQSVAPIEETQVVLAATPDQPVIHTSGKPSGYRVYLGTLEPVNTDTDPSQIKLTVLLRTPNGEEESWPLETVRDKTVILRDGVSKLAVAGYWPDFAMRGGKPVSLSPDLKNPAILVHLQISSAGTVPTKPTLTLAPLANGTIRYQLAKQGKIYSSGELKKNEPLALGWADWQAALKIFEPKAKINRHLIPSPQTESASVTANQSPMSSDSGLPGIRARLTAPNGNESDPRWIASGTSGVLTLGNEVIRVGFGLKPIALPFTVTLEKFEVPRDEGTNTPANFISSLRFDDPAMTEPRRDVAKMNYPAMHPGGFWRSLVGWNYKFSQAQWNPEDLGETTLQVLYDPGWPLKWIGSLLICAGIVVMFYFKSPKPANPPTS